jgi:galactokinase/mevalonate kinase-like predicted kinase
MAVPTLLYGSEAWTMKRADFQKILTSDIKFLRAVGGYNLLDKKKSEEIRKELLVNELNEQINSVEYSGHNMFRELVLADYQSLLYNINRKARGS